MATRIIEYVSNDPSMIGAPIVPADGQITEQGALTTSTTPANTAAFDPRTNLICVQCDEATYVSKPAISPAVSVNSYRIQAGQEQFFRVPVGQSCKVAVRQ